MKTIETKFGTIGTKPTNSFGYGYVYVQDGIIHYHDMTEHKTWKTVKGFERWADKMNAICGGGFEKMGA